MMNLIIYSYSQLRNNTDATTTDGEDNRVVSQDDFYCDLGDFTKNDEFYHLHQSLSPRSVGYSISS